MSAKTQVTTTTTTTTDKRIAAAEQRLAVLLKEAHAEGIFERVQIWIARMARGRKLSAYLRDDAIPVKERCALADGLVEILLTRQYDRLPPLGMSGEKVARPRGRGEGEGEGEGPSPKPEISEAKATPVPAEEVAELPAPDELRAMVDAAVREQIAEVLAMVVRALRA